MKMQLDPHKIGDIIFSLRVQVTPAANLLAKLTVFTVDYELMHLLGDGLCWVYNPPINLYGKLSTFGLYLLYSV